jgi:uncharacterized membrane protein
MKDMMDILIDPTLFVIGPIVSLMVLVGIVAAYLLWKERRESREQTSAIKRH